MENLTSFINGINDAADIVVSGLFILALVFLSIRYMIGRMQHYVKKEGANGLGKGIFLGVIAMVEAVILGFVILQIPKGLSAKTCCRG